MELGRILREARQSAELTQRQLASTAGVPQSLICRYEKGTRRLPWATWLRLLAALDLEPEIRLMPLHGSLDDAIDAIAALPIADRLASQQLLVGRTLGAFAQHLDVWAVTGPLAALLQGVPVPVECVDLLVPDDDRVLPRVGQALRTSRVLFHEARVAELRHLAGQVQWGLGTTEFCYHLVPQIPQTISVVVDGVVVPVVPLTGLDLDEPLVRRALERVGLGLAHD